MHKQIETVGNLTNLIVTERKSGLATLQEIIDLQKKATRAIVPVVGDCMEGLNIPNGGFVAVDFTRFPRPQRKGAKITDACLCYGTFPGQQTPSVMIKMYLGVWGTEQNVGTMYGQKPGEPFRWNCGFFADAVFGVAFASWDADGNLLWETDPDTYPDHLQTAPTIHGVGISDPIKVVPV